ncbi:MAG: hypothetical protein ACI8V5_003559, partial [Limisphaerales bacterium]|jgi:hypothetical protein
MTENKTKHDTNRRAFLKGAGMALALPLLESSPGFRARAVAADSPGYLSDGKPRRMVCICNNMGFYGPNILPDGDGRGYRPSRYLKVIDDLRDDYTVFSGVAHPEVDGGHAAEKCYLTTAPHPGGNSFKNTISLDQFAAPFVGRETRFPSLVLTANGAQSLSWTRAGVPIPGYTSPAQVFSKLFFNGTRQEVDAQVMRLRQGQSIMDAALAQASALRRSLDAPDREKLDEYLTSVREVEKQMLRQQEWERKPRPKVSAKPPKDIEGEGDVTGRTRLMYDLTRLALETDSTRLITIFVEGFFVVPPIKGIDQGYHTVAHHSKDPEKIKQLGAIETEQFRIFRDLLTKLKGSKEQGESLLDRTMVLYGSDIGNGSSHDTRNLPAILAGGGFKHGQHLAFDRDNNYPLGNLYVSMLQRLGIEASRFGSGRGTMRGLEMV